MECDLCFREDGTFTIVQLTDLHWHNGEGDDRLTRRLTELVLDTEAPDLVVLTGDIIAGAGCLDPAESWRQVVVPVERRGIPWAAVFGNHDDEGSLNRHELMEVQRSCAFCLSEPGPPDLPGVGNYVLPIRARRGEAKLAVLYFLDSGSYAPTKIGGYAWVAREQVNWYAATAARLAEAYARRRSVRPQLPERLPALAFFHIPLPEYDEVWDHFPCWGVKYEPICCPRVNSGLFAAMHEAGDVMGVFVGHDHVNDFVGNLHGIRLCYGRAGGYATYGREGFPRGARVIRLYEGRRDFDTWLRLDDGSQVRVQEEHAPRGRVLTSSANMG